MAGQPEPSIQINGRMLTDAQAMSVRVATTSFHMEVSDDAEIRNGLGLIADGYRDRLGEVLKLMLMK